MVSAKIEDPRQEIIHKNGDIFDNWVFKQRRRLIVDDSQRDFRFNMPESIDPDQRKVRSVISAPLISENKLLGILRLDNAASKVYNADDLRLLDIISDLAAVAVENSRLYQKIQKLAITEGLTGLFVHRYFHQRFDEEISRAFWTNSEFSFLMLDIDNFKTYNDKYGHISGDIVLKQIARIISESVNPGDIVARYGGEEFAVLLVDIKRAEAEKIAERIRKRIEQKQFVLRRQVSQVCISGGLSFFPKDGKLKESLIQRADQALYKAKDEGKNRICIL